VDSGDGDDMTSFQDDFVSRPDDGTENDAAMDRFVPVPEDDMFIPMPGDEEMMSEDSIDSDEDVSEEEGDDSDFANIEDIVPDDTIRVGQQQNGDNSATESELEPIGGDDRIIPFRNRPQGYRAEAFQKTSYQLEDCHNDMFEKCSNEYHRLRSLMACYDAGAFRKLYEAIDKKRGTYADAGECIPREKTSLSLQSRVPPIVCDACPATLQYDFRTTILIAAMCGRREDLWMAVIRNDGPQIRVTRKNGGLFETSHTCNTFQNSNVCVSKEHIVLELSGENKAREGHHTGRYGCFCAIPCIGSAVQRNIFTTHDKESTKTNSRKKLKEASKTLSDAEIIAHDSNLPIPIACVAALAQTWIDESNRPDLDDLEPYEEDVYEMACWAASLTASERAQLLVHDAPRPPQINKDGSVKRHQCASQAMVGLLQLRRDNDGSCVSTSFAYWFPSRKPRSLTWLITRIKKEQDKTRWDEDSGSDEYDDDDDDD
jgi:hypothetical protein